ncbi:MAG: hypothetical protein RL701_5810, partial [Pseudomonadota bacterium]
HGDGALLVGLVVVGPAAERGHNTT